MAGTRAVIYTRLSDSSKVEGSVSLATQEQGCRVLAAERGLTVVKVYEEQGWSGALEDRPALWELKQDARDGRFDVLITHDVDRFSRDMPIQILCERDLEKAGVQILYVNTSESLLERRMKSMLAEYELYQILERTTRAKVARAKSGRILCTRNSPYGFKFVLGEGRVEVDPVEGPLVQRMFDMALQGNSSHEIARRLTREGIRARSGGGWWAPQISRILANPMYFGDYAWRKTVSVEPKKRRAERQFVRRHKSSFRARPPEEHIHIRIPPLVTREVWEAVQEQKTANRTNSPRNTRYEALLSGLFFCGECGSRMYVSGAKSARRYVCKRALSTTVTATGERCRSSTYNVLKTDEEVWHKVLTRLKTPVLLEAALGADQDRTFRQEKADREALKSIQDELMKLDRQSERFRHLFATERSTEGEYDRDMAGIKIRRAALERSQAKIEERAAHRAQAVADRETIELLVMSIESWPTNLSFGQKRKVLETLRTRIVSGREHTYSLSGLVDEYALSLAVMLGLSLQGKRGAGPEAQAQELATLGEWDSTFKHVFGAELREILARVQMAYEVMGSDVHGGTVETEERGGRMGEGGDEAQVEEPKYT